VAIECRDIACPPAAEPMEFEVGTVVADDIDDVGDDSSHGPAAVVNRLLSSLLSS
jgi:hypothetical protein